MLPDQTTGADLRDRLRAAEEALRRRPALPEHARVRRVRGGELVRQGLGYAEVWARGHHPMLPHLQPLVEITFEEVSEGQVLLETTPARLVRIEEAWQHSLVGEPKTQHLLDAESSSITITLAAEEETLLLRAPRVAEGTPGRQRYEIAPAATEIRMPDGEQGVLRYAHGLEVDVTGTAPLLRIGPDGTLTRRPGGIYAQLVARQPASVRIGNTWITTPLLQRA